MTTYVEKAPHVDPVRMRRISDDALLTDFAAGSVSALRVRFADPGRPRPVWDVQRWADGVRELAVQQPHTADRLTGSQVAQADALLDRQVDFLDRSLGRSRFYGFHYLSWLAPLLSAYALTGDGRYAACFGRIFGQWYDERDRVVGDWPGLDVIWYSLGVAGRSGLLLKALAVFATEPSVSDARWAQALKTVVGGARWSAEEHDTFRYGNWQLYACAELLHAGAVLPELAESAGWVEVAKARLRDHLDLDVHPDGGHRERSPGYHSMCLNALHRAAVVGEQYLDWPLADEPRLVAMHDWLVTLATQAGWVPHFQDSGVVWPGQLLLYGDYLYPGRGYGDLAARWLNGDELASERAWLPPRPPDRAPAVPAPAAGAGRAGSQLLTTSRYAVLRGAGETATLHAVVNYGPHVGHELESHSHHAALDLVISGSGLPLAWEAGGPPSYDDPGYYDWYQATRGHNTIAPPGVELSTDRTAVLEQFVTRSTVDVFTAHHDGYGRQHRRRVVFVRAEPGYWLVTDELAGGGDFLWRLYGRDPWLADGRGYRAARGPGLLVRPVQPDVVTDVGRPVGPARIPDPSSRTADYGEIHGLELAVAGGVAEMLLVAFASEPAPVEVARDGDGVLVRLGGVQDRVIATSWTRTDAEGRVLGSAEWTEGQIDE